jgi:hypothetical protein
MCAHKRETGALTLLMDAERKEKSSDRHKEQE